MLTVGIDLGTTYSMIAHVNLHGQPALFPDLNDASQFRTPSVIHIGPEGAVVGSAVDELLMEGSDISVVRFVKSYLTKPDFRYRDHAQRHWSPEALSALLLRKLVRDAYTFAGEKPGGCVVTVPAQFTDGQRRATQRAAALAGLGHVRLIEEPIAAATHYGLDEGTTDQTLLVYDFGGGTFDVCILQAAPDGLFVLATDGVSNLGGRVLDERFMDMADGAYRKRFGLSILDDGASSQRLRRMAEEAKIKFSNPLLNQVRNSIMLRGHAYEFLLTRSQYDGVVDPAVEASLVACERCLEACGLTWRDIDKILLTGGSSMLPAVSKTLMARSGKPARSLVTKQPHQAVTFGAAILASRFFSGSTDKEFKFQNICGADIALRVWDPVRGQPGLEILIARNTPLPVSYTRVFFTSRYDQTRMNLRFVQRRGDPLEEFGIGEFVFGPILAPEMNYPIEVTIMCAMDGIVHVTACDQKTGRAIDHILVENEGLGGFPEQQALVDHTPLNYI